MDFAISDKKKKDIFVSVFQLLKNTTSQINATFRKDKLHIQGMDKSHICLFNLYIDSSWFHQYSLETETEFQCSFDTNAFYSIISIKGDEQTLHVKQNGGDQLNIELIHNNSKGKDNDYNKYFTIPLLEYDYETMNVPITEYDAEFTLPSKKVTDMLSQLSNFGNDIKINCLDDWVDFKTKGDLGEMRVNIQVDDMVSYSVVEGEEVCLTYSLTYISKMCITNKLTADIEFSLSNQCPMRINYDFGDNSCLTFYIAPKLEDD